MILHIAMLLAFQLAGEVAVRLSGLAVPGPVVGMVLLLVFLVLRPGVAEAVRPTVQTLLGHLSLLFVPAGVGVVGHLGLLAEEGLAIAAALVVSTILAIAVGALVFDRVARLTGAAGKETGQ